MLDSMGKRILSFEIEMNRRRAYARGDRGHQTVETRRIVGSVGRAAELDAHFRYRRLRGHPAEDVRTRRVRELFASGKVPPVDLYQIGEDLFVVDGHHRVRVAREQGQDFLEAHVVEYLPDRADPANAIYYERQAFVVATGLHEIHATEVGRYPRLLNRIRDYRHDLSHLAASGPASILEDPRLFPFGRRYLASVGSLEAGARAWYLGECQLVVEVLQTERVDETFRGKTMGDLYGYVCDHRWYLSERQGWDVGLEDALVDFVHRHAPTSSVDSLVDPVIALGSDLLDRAPSGFHTATRRANADPRFALIAGVLALPLAFLRGLRPRHYRFVPFCLKDAVSSATSDS